MFRLLGAGYWRNLHSGNSAQVGTCWDTEGVVFVADDLVAWLISLLADTGRERLTTLVLGNAQERALRSAATAAVRRTAEELRPSEVEQAEHLAMVVSEVFRSPVPLDPLTGQATLLEALQAGIARQLAVLDDASLTGTGQSSADVLGVPGTAVAEKLTEHLLREIISRATGGGPLFPLASQLNEDVTHLQGQRTEAVLGQLAGEVRQAMARLDRQELSQAAAVVVRPNEVAGRVFISYVREDSHRVDRLQHRLEAAGIPVWRDTADLWPGEDWRVMIRRAITESALVFIACFSRASLARDRSYQNEELTLAIEQLRIRLPEDPWLIPVRFDECDIPDRDIGAGRTLRSIHRADLFDDRFDEGAMRVLRSVSRILGKRNSVNINDDRTADAADQSLDNLSRSIVAYERQDAPLLPSPDAEVETRTEVDVRFYTVVPSDLDRAVCVVQAFDHQWLPDDLLQVAMASRRGMRDELLERERLRCSRTEYLRALVNSGQLVINHAFCYNNQILYRDYAEPGPQREAFKELISSRAIVPYLLTESSPVIPPSFSMLDAGWEGWKQIAKESPLTCLRLSWDSAQNAAHLTSELIMPFAQFIATVDDLDAGLLAAELRLPTGDVEALANRLQEVAAWARQWLTRESSLTRFDVYREFVVADETHPGDGRYDPAKPFAAVIKKLADLRYNVSLPDALGAYLIVPNSSPQRRLLQEWHTSSPGHREPVTDGYQLSQVMSNLHFDRLGEIVDAPATFDSLTLGDIVNLRSTDAGSHYYSALRDFTAQTSLEMFGDPYKGAEFIAHSYTELIKETRYVASAKSASRQPWLPIVEMIVEYGGGVLQIYFNFTGNSARTFHISRPLMPGASARTSSVVIHLGIGRAIQSSGLSPIYNSIEVLRVKLDHGREDWEAFIGGLRKNHFREI